MISRRLINILFIMFFVGLTSFFLYHKDVNKDIHKKIKESFPILHERFFKSCKPQERIASLPFTMKSLNNLCDPNKTFTAHLKVLSYCSFGTKEFYLSGIPKVIENRRNSSFYKDWVVRIYHDGNIPKRILEKYDQEDVQFCNAYNVPHYRNLRHVFGMFWRFVPLADPSVDVMCSRDLDSAIILREEDAMKEFMESNAVLHSMRDNPGHGIPMLGGMWCYKNILNRAAAKYYFETILAKASAVKVGEDQSILNSVMWGHARELQKLGVGEIMVHDSYFCTGYGVRARPFPVKRRPDDYFIGRPMHERSFINTTLKRHLICPVVCRPSYGKDWENC